MTSDPAARIEVLLVEDNPGDAWLAEEHLRESRISNRLHTVPDGEQALDFLRRASPYADAPRPDLILLDLNLPRKDGREVLSEIKADPSLRAIPTVVLSSSKAEADVVGSYELHANAYVAKPVDLESYQDVIHAIESFWFATARLPGRRS